MAKAPVLTPQAEDFPRWYQDVVAKAELADNGPVRGTMVIRPYGYAIWERMQAEVDRRIKAAGAENAYFPLFIPESYLKREAEHVEGFSPELAVVTLAGGKELEEPVVVRPTSETVIGEYMAKWIQSYRDLPLLLNQWANVVRWELRPRLFLRTSEFLWQEGHTAHATEDDARAYAERILHEVYADFMIDVLAMPGRRRAARPPSERFAGAINTLTCEAMMGDGKALQMGTSHELGQNFAKAFDIEFLDAAGAQQHAWTTSWGVSTRMVGGLIMAHGDDARPAGAAPARPRSRWSCSSCATTPTSSPGAGRWPTSCAPPASGCELDDRVDLSVGRRATDWELKGVPVRLELGPRDLADEVVTLVGRIAGTEGAGARSPASPRSPRPALDEASRPLLRPRPPARRDGRTVDVATLDEAARGRHDRVRPAPLGARRRRGRGRAGHVRGHRPLPGAGRRRPARRPTTSPTWSPSPAARTDPRAGHRSGGRRRPADAGSSRGFCYTPASQSVRVLSERRGPCPRLSFR